ncbi:MAG: hypothetical protein QHH26_12125 [Armatimonadota bacterium]|nr:hypothetical protein [Armatimonadota bacterium]
MSKYYVQRKTETQGDVFAAVGLAKLLDSEEHPAHIRMEGDYFIVEAMDSQNQNYSKLSRKSIYRYLVNGKVNAPAEIPFYNLVEAKELEQRKEEQRNKLEAERKRNPNLRNDPDIQQKLEEYAPDPEYRLYRFFSTMQADTGANKALEYTHSKQSNWPQELQLALKGMQNPAGAIPNVNLGASGNQLMNPLIAKGSYGIKPSGTNRHNPKIADTGDNEIFQYFRYGGYFSAAVPYQDEKQNLRLLTPIPKDISLTAFELIVQKLRSSKFFKSKKLKLDVLASLRVAALLIEHSEYASSEQPNFAKLFISNYSPADLISGLHITHYLKTSQFGKNVTELSFVAVPGWFPIKSKEDADSWRSIIEEHQNILRNLDESNSEEISLLQQYRKFLQIRDTEAFTELICFISNYGAYWMSATNDPRRRRMPRFTTSTLERMVESMAPNISAILKNPHFQSIAKAIRKSTVSAQAQKAMGKKPWREIRYGLVAELNRKRFVKEELIEALAIFVTQYNSENARRRENKESLKAAPSNITTEDLEGVAALIDETDNPALIGALLCAYGTCREPAAEAEEIRQEEEELLESEISEIEEVETE